MLQRCMRGRLLTCIFVICAGNNCDLHAPLSTETRFLKYRTRFVLITIIIVIFSSGLFRSRLVDNTIKLYGQTRTALGRYDPDMAAAVLTLNTIDMLCY